MHKMLYFDYSAVVLEFVLLASILMRRMTNGKSNSMFIMLVTISIFTTSADIIAVTFDNLGSEFYYEKMMSHSVYLFLRALISFIQLNYVIVLTDTWFKAANNFTKKIKLFFPIFLLAALMITNFFAHNIFYIDENGTYIRGANFLWLYVINGYYAVYGSMKIFRNSQMMDMSRIVSLFVGTFLMMGADWIQIMIPSVLIDMFACSIALLFIFMMVQRPEEITDSETGLIKLNTYAYDLKRSFINKKPETLIMIRLNNYLVIREMLGYRDTICVKRMIADIIVRYLRSSRVRADVYYIGSGNYRIRLENHDNAEAVKVAEYINDTLKEGIVYNEMQINLVTCVCITNIPEDIDEFDSLSIFGNDFSAEYTGNVLYASEICRKSRYDIMREIDKIIENAISENEFEVYYQPIYSIKDKKFNSAEALLRLKTEKYGFISPELFIPAAEKSGAIHRIGEIVMESVCSFIGSEEYAELGLDYIEVNLSPAQCMENNLAKNMIGIMERNHVLPSQLNLEITETASGEIQNVVMDNITTLYNAGISLSLDDFGTGYSNMTRIASLPFHIIKLDKTFTRIKENPNLIIVLENVIKMIKALNMKIVVEGIETKELVDHFERMECEYIQGYYYSKPLPKRDFVKFIQAGI